MSRPNYLNAKTAIVGIQGCYNFYLIKLDYCHNENAHEIVFGINFVFVCLLVRSFRGVLNNNGVLIFRCFFLSDPAVLVRG